MRKEMLICDNCNEVIKSGFIVRGNIYAADPNTELKLLGDNISINDNDVVGVSESHLCKECFKQYLNL